MKKVYVLLTRTTTMFSTLINSVTKDKYTHASIGLDRNFDKLYSFGRRHKHFPLLCGFIEENIFEGVFGDNLFTNCAIYSIDVTDECYEKLSNKLDYMCKNKKKYKYNIMGLLNFVFNTDISNRDKYFCSEFVSHVLDECGAIKFEKTPNHIKPSNFCEMREFELEYEGELISCII